MGIIRAIEKREKVILHVLFSEAICLKDLKGVNVLVRGSGIDVPISFLVRGSEVRSLIFLLFYDNSFRLGLEISHIRRSKPMKESEPQSDDLERISKGSDCLPRNNLLLNNF